MPFLHAGPVPRPTDWAAHVNSPQTEAEVGEDRIERIRRGIAVFEADQVRSKAVVMVGHDSIPGANEPRRGQSK